MDQDILTDDISIALDISSMSEYPEEEVLILPHTSFQIQTIKHLPCGLIEIVAEYIDLSMAHSRSIAFMFPIYFLTFYF